MASSGWKDVHVIYPFFVAWHLCGVYCWQRWARRWWLGTVRVLAAARTAVKPGRVSRSGSSGWDPRGALAPGRLLGPFWCRKACSPPSLPLVFFDSSSKFQKTIVLRLDSIFRTFYVCCGTCKKAFASSLSTPSILRKAHRKQTGKSSQPARWGPWDDGGRAPRRSQELGSWCGRSAAALRRCLAWGRVLWL